MKIDAEKMSFNPSKVRYKPCWYCGGAGLQVGFNPSKVRYKRMRLDFSNFGATMFQSLKGKIQTPKRLTNGNAFRSFNPSKVRYKHVE